MNDLKFDIFAFVNPKNASDKAQALQEAINELANINEQLDSILSNASTDDFKPVREMLMKYFNVEVSCRILKSICMKNRELYVEVLKHSETDTHVREMFIDAVLEHFCLVSWPIHSANNEYRDRFFSTLNKIAPRNSSGVNVFPS